MKKKTLEANSVKDPTAVISSLHEQVIALMDVLDDLDTIGVMLDDEETSYSLDATKWALMSAIERVDEAACVLDLFASEITG